MVTRYLLDTHSFLWWIEGDERLPVSIRQIVNSSVVQTHASIVTAWEIAIKTGIGKLTDPGNIESLFIEGGLLPLPLEFDHVERYKTLPLHHRDPFDRMLIAQALVENLTLISNETIFDKYGVARVWE